MGLMGQGCWWWAGQTNKQQNDGARVLMVGRTNKQVTK